MFDPNEFGTEIVNAVKCHVAAVFGPVQIQIDQLKVEIKKISDRQPEKGEQGPPGNDGVGLASSFIDQDGRLVFTFTDGTVGSVGHVVGTDGKDAAEIKIDELICAPSEMVEEIAKAIALAAESPPLQQAQLSANPVVVNFVPPIVPKRGKTITTRRDDKGNLIAQVMESN